MKPAEGAAAISRPRLGAVIYRGPSELPPHAPIIAAVSGFVVPSRNPKTGPMLQTWILYERSTPLDALRAGDDASICGSCALRAHGCYVQVRHAPTNIWRAVMAGKYTDVLTTAERHALGRGRAIRLGSYGDPAAVPWSVWGELLAYADTWAGYTHQWAKGCHPNLKLFCMASVDTPEQQARAQAEGWRTFRVRQDGDARLPGEIVCPASDEWVRTGRKSTQCIRCRLCEGASKQAKSIAIRPHGTRARHVNQWSLFDDAE